MNEREVKTNENFLNILWFICGGFISWLQLVITGLLLCITIIGIPWGKQFFKIAAVSFMPFGSEVRLAHVF